MVVMQQKETRKVGTRIKVKRQDLQYKLNYNKLSEILGT